MDLVVELPTNSPNGVATRRYRAVAKLGGGSFGDILAAVNEHDPEDWLALKVEARYSADDPERSCTRPSMVRYEDVVCRQLARSAGVMHRLGGPGTVGRHLPCAAVRGCVNLHDEHDVLAMELLGPDLRSYADSSGSWPLDENIVLVLGAVLVERLRQLHDAGFVHRDLKPENMLLRLETSEEEGRVPCLVLVDYALAMRYVEPKRPSWEPQVQPAHIRQSTGVDPVGTHRYMAVHAQQGVTQSRRSDLEGLAYVLLHLALGKLPWQNVKDVHDMLRVKEHTDPRTLCADLRSKALETFLARCRALQFDEEPDYQSLQRVLLSGVSGPLEFRAGEVRRAFKRQLQESYLRVQAIGEARRLAWLPGCDRDRAGGCGRTVATTGNVISGNSILGVLPTTIYVVAKRSAQDDATDVFMWQPLCASNVTDCRTFILEVFEAPLRGTIHIVIGAHHFFAFWKEDLLRKAYQEGGLEARDAEEIRVYSNGRRDWLVRAMSVKGFDLREWNHRSTFWSRIVFPRSVV